MDQLYDENDFIDTIFTESKQDTDSSDEMDIPEEK